MSQGKDDEEDKGEREGTDTRTIRWRTGPTFATTSCG